MFEGLRKPKSLIVIVVTLLTYGCPIQAIVHALDLDERTVASWRDRAGMQCQRVHQAMVEQGQLDLVHVQADEIRVKGRSQVVWMGLALMVSTRRLRSPEQSVKGATAIWLIVCCSRCEPVRSGYGRSWWPPMDGQHIPTVSSEHSEKK
jgi:hypothetical protein